MLKEDPRITKINNAMYEATRFIGRAKLAHRRLCAEGGIPYWATKETAACKRASMDLTRALAELRKS